jgi:hypothetical protein
MPNPEVPPSTLQISDTSDAGVYSSTYVFTQARMYDGSSVENMGSLGIFYRYRMSVTVNSTQPASIFTYIEFDFLANDFRLRLARITDDGTVVGIAYGSSDLAPNQEENFDFRNELAAVLEPGRYYVDILEEIAHKPFNFTSYCHAFGFSLVGTAQTEDRLSFIDPPNGYNLNPTENLALWLVFSESIGAPKPQSLFATVVQTNAIRLLNRASADNAILPNQVEYNHDRTAIRVIFDSSSFAFGQVCRGSLATVPHCLKLTCANTVVVGIVTLMH